VKLIREHPGIVSRSSAYADEGTLLHKVVADSLLKPELAADVLLECSKEQRDAVEYCLSVYNGATEHLRGAEGLYETLIETQVSLRTYGLPQVRGTADCIVIDAKNKKVHVIDWKFGKGVKVDVEDNPQLYAYALGALALAPRFISTVIVQIVQPRLDSCRSVTLEYLDLSNWLQETLKPAIEEAGRANPRRSPGPKQCRWCPVRPVCPEALELARDAARAAFEGFYDAMPGVTEPQPAEPLHDVEIVSSGIVEIYKELMPRLSELKSIIKMMEDVAPVLVEQGLLPGFKLVNGPSRSVWRGNKEDVAKRLKELGIEPFSKKLVTVAQAKALLEKGCTLPEDLYIKEPGALRAALDKKD
jgi:hypothetical protein